MPLIAAIAIQTFVVTQVGIRIGSRLGERWRENAERIAGVALILLGAALLAARLAG